jgi:phage shock protein C
MATETKRLYRSRHDRMIGGVCGGIATYFNTDPTIIRLLFVLGLLLVGGTFWAYIIMMIVIPEETDYVPPQPPTTTN